MSIVIKARDLSKIYRLGVLSSRTISQDFNRFIARLRGKEDPFLKVNEYNVRNPKKKNSLVYALKDINFEVKEGEILGIIGKNGAGKSTLLKILSRVTSPSQGVVNIKGRIASLLEVGTGFHQELTGRENIFLNGSILGMTKNEISRKLDEIIDFSGVEKYIDTPVKRYSSGMYVRLAFAVAAHLEPEILIVDEVLAVGDVEFQKKCLGKMQEVSSEKGRTILFVSHNMGAVRMLCSRALLIEKGHIINSGNTEDIIQNYLYSNSSGKNEFISEDNNAEIFIKKISVNSDNSKTNSNEIDVRYPFKIKISYKIKEHINGLGLAFSVISKKGFKVFYSSCVISDLLGDSINVDGLHETEVTIPENFLTPGSYYINVSIQIENIQLFDLKEHAVDFEVIESGTSLHRFSGKDIGVVLVDLDWKNVSEEIVSGS